MRETVTQTLETELCTLVEGEMERWNVPGVALAILAGDETRAWGLGVASIETQQPVTPDTLFRICSISKVFTTTLVMMLVDDGLLDLDAPIITYLPELPLADEGARQTLTLRHLLSHTGGFQTNITKIPDQGAGALGEYIDTFRLFPPLVRSGDAWAYSNSGFSLAAYVVERVLGTSFEQALRERVFEPLGLERTVTFEHEAIVYPVAIGHRITPNGAEVERNYLLHRAGMASGGLISTVGDLMKFAAFHLRDGVVNGRQILSVESVRAMQEPQI